jgi:hypothetical protein
MACSVGLIQRGITTSDLQRRHCFGKFSKRQLVGMPSTRFTQVLAAAITCNAVVFGFHYLLLAYHTFAGDERSVLF